MPDEPTADELLAATIQHLEDYSCTNEDHDHMCADLELPLEEWCFECKVNDVVRCRSGDLPAEYLKAALRQLSKRARLKGHREQARNVDGTFYHDMANTLSKWAEEVT